MDARITKLENAVKSIRHQNLTEAEVSERVAKEYTQLRIAWEKEVEEGMLGGVIQRFSPIVQTQRLDLVSFGDDEIKTVQDAMGHCNRFAHDQNPRQVGRLPTTNDLEKDIEVLKEFDAQRKAAQNKARKNRKKP